MKVIRAKLHGIRVTSADLNYHGSITLDLSEDMIRAGELTGGAPIVRPVANRPDSISPFLDRGAWGVQVPHVNTRAEAEAAVAACKYYPEGTRGIFSRGRPAEYGMKESTQAYAASANANTLVCLMLEEVEAINNIDEIVQGQAGVPNIVWQPLAFIIFFISALAELNRAPFDIPVGESEVVGGPFVEYSGIRWSMFFLGEYANMILMSAMTTILFLGGWLAPFNMEPFTWIPGPIWFIAKVSFCLFVFLWVRATFPRYRYDQLMRLGWKVFLPLSLGWVILTAGVLVAFDKLPKL